MKTLFKVVFFLLCVHIANAQTPIGSPTINSPGWAKYRWLQSDSGYILPKRDTNWLPAFPTAVLWQRPGIDTAIWVFPGQRPWVRLAKSTEVSSLPTWYNSNGSIAGSRSINFLNTGVMNWNNILAWNFSNVSPVGFRFSANPSQLYMSYTNGSTREVLLDAATPDGGMQLAVTRVNSLGPGTDVMLQMDTIKGFSAKGIQGGGLGTNPIIVYDPVTNQIKTKDPFTASNGATIEGSDIRLGGPSGAAFAATLQSNREIPMNGNDLHLSGNGRLFIDTGRIVIGQEVDPLYGLTVKKVYEGVTQANYVATVGKYPLIVDKHVQITEDSLSFWPIAGDNAGLFGLRYRGQSIVNMENTVNRITASHSVLFLEKYPAFGDTTVFQGRVSPLNAQTCIPSGFSAILSQSQGGLASTRPNLSTGWFAALSAEVQLGGTAFNKMENAIWIHTGGIGIIPANAITNGFGLYINGFGSGVVNKYAIYQQGTVDTSYFAGRVRIPNLITQTDTSLYHPAVVDAKGNLSRLTYWPVGSGGGGGGVSSVSATDGNGFDFTITNPTTTPDISLTTSLTTASVPFIGASGALSQDNANFNFDNTNDRLSIAAGTSPAARVHINTDALGGSLMTFAANSAGLYLSNNTAAANNSQQVSPGVVFAANGWGTTAGTSQTQYWKIGQVPIQGATATSNFQINYSNGGAFNNAFTLTAGGQLQIGSIVAGASIIAGASNQLSWNGRSIMTSPSNGNIIMANSSATGFGLLIFGQATSSFPALKVNGANLQVRQGGDAAFSDLEVLDEIYGVDWNGSIEVPTKNAVYDKIEALLPDATYTPTYTGVTNTTLVTAQTTYYQVAGNVVRVWGYVIVTPSAASLTTTEVGVSLPVAASLSQVSQCVGVAYIENGPGVADAIGYIKPDPGLGTRALLTFKSLSTGAQNVFFSFTYRI